jgi:hypothetical protein
MHTVYATSEGQKFAGDASLVVVCCNQCHITYAIPESLDKAMLRWRGDKSNGWKTTCPMGHTWWYVGENDIERAERIAANARQREQATRDLLHHEERSHAATKGHLTRQKRRASAGMCPCCNRTFQQLKRHMDGQHPEYVEANAPAAARDGDDAA